MRPLASANFQWLWLAQVVSAFGDRFTAIAVPLLVYSLTDSPLQLSFAFISQVLAALIFGLWAGALSDRWDRLRIMMTADWLRAGLVALIPLVLLLDLSQQLTLGIIYLLSFCVAALGQFYVPAKVSLIPKLVSEELLVEANSLDQGTMKVMEFVGYSMAGILVAEAGAAAAFVVDAATFGIAALLLSFISMRDSAENTPTLPDESILESVKAGIVEMTGVPELRRLSAISLLAPIAIGATLPLTIIFVQDALGLSEAYYGFWQAAIGLGIAIGIFAIGRFLSGIRRESLVTGGVIAFGVFQMLTVLLLLFLRRFADFPDIVLMAAAVPLIMLTAAGNGSIFLGLRTMVQEFTPREMIGRVFGAITVISSLAIALGQLMGGLVTWFDVNLLLIFWSVFLIVVGVVAQLLAMMQRAGEK